MKSRILLGGALFASGYLCNSYITSPNVDSSIPYTISYKNDSYVLNGPTFSKIITPSGELGSIYQRMQGLLLEEELELEYALKKIQRSKLADSTPSSD